MSELEKISDFQRLSDEDFLKKYNQTKHLALRDWEEESLHIYQTIPEYRDVFLNSLIYDYQLTKERAENAFQLYAEAHQIKSSSDVIEWQKSHTLKYAIRAAYALYQKHLQESSNAPGSVRSDNNISINLQGLWQYMSRNGKKASDMSEEEIGEFVKK